MMVWLSTPTPTAGRFRASEFLRTTLQKDWTLPLPPPPLPLLHAPNDRTPSITTATDITVRARFRIRSLCLKTTTNGIRAARARLTRYAHRPGRDRSQRGVAGPGRR